jgi:hypothetical protein
MLDRTRALVAAAGATNYYLVLADAMNFVFLANTFHGVPDRLGLARAVAAILKPKGQFGSSTGIVFLERKRWFSTSLADQGRKWDGSR